MHPSLQPTKIRFLPFAFKARQPITTRLRYLIAYSTQDRAKALCTGNGTRADLQILIENARIASSDTMPHFFAVFYALLDATALGLDSEVEIENIAEKTVELAYATLYAVAYTRTLQPLRAACYDLWLRAWPWIRLFATYGNALRGLPPSPTSTDDLCVMGLLVLAKLVGDHNTAEAVRSTPGAAFVVARAWSAYPRGDVATSRQESIEGAEGIGRLAQLLRQAIRFAAMDMVERLDGTRRNSEKEAMEFARNVVVLLRSLDPTLELESANALSPFSTALVTSKCILPLVELAHILVDYERGGLESTVAYDLLLIVAHLISPAPGHAHVHEAGQIIVHTIMKFACRITPAISPRLSPSARVQAQDLIREYFTRIFPPLLLDFKLLRGIELAWGETHPDEPAGIEELAVFGELRTSTGNDDAWTPFYALLSSRVAAYRRYLVDGRDDWRICDSCDGLFEKTEVAKCAECSTLVYCSRACQEWHWTHGGHKRVCAGYRLLREREHALGMGSLQKAFVRHLLAMDLPGFADAYEDAYRPQAGGTGFIPVVLCDYTSGRLVASLVHPEVDGVRGVLARHLNLDANDSDTMSALEDIALRADYSEGAIEILVVKLPDGWGRSRSVLVLQRTGEQVVSAYMPAFRRQSLGDYWGVGGPAARKERERLKDVFSVQKLESVTFYV
ncbi:MYND-type domain-containing protein [Mycena kentingensis (nom. inval.)]|nr:MYND-type domain-containing protein [Mycena kentingensis (nom. inval.)]